MTTKLFRGFLSYLSSFLLLCGTVPCGMFCLITALELPVNEPVLWTGGIALCAVSALIWSLPKYRFVPVGLSLFSILGLLFYDLKDALEGTFSPLMNGGAVVGSAIIMAYREIFSQLDPSYPITQMTEGETVACATWLLLVIMALQALFLGWAIVQRRSLWRTLAGTLPLLIIPIAITRLPNTLPLIGVLTGWLVLLLSGGAKRGERWTYTKLSILLLPLCALFLSVLSLVIPKEAEATRPGGLTTIRTELVGQLSNFAAGLAEGDLLSGLSIGTVADQSTSVDFSQIGTLRRSRDTYFSVVTTAAEPLYIRRLSLGNYTGEGWAQFDSNTAERLADHMDNMEIWAVGSIPYTFRSEYMETMLSSSSGAASEYLNQFDSMTVIGSDSSFVYTTYQNLLPWIGYTEKRAGISIPEVQAKADSYLTFMSDGGSAGSAEQYSVYFFTPDEETASEMILLGLAHSTPSEYASEIDGYYTDLSSCSQEELAALDALLDTVDFSGVENSLVPTIEAAERIVDALKSAATYDLNVQTVSQDFALHFLETGKGYCVHFATTAALLCRIYGIPARFVSGYLVDPSEAGEDGMIAVGSLNAHAWVEIFIDGYGWYPIEATPAAGLTVSTDQAGNNSEEEEAAQDTGTETAETDTQQDDSPESTGQTQTENANTQTQGEPEAVSTLSRMMAPLLLVLVIGGFILRRRLAQHSRVKRFSGENPNQNTIALWLYLQTLSHYYKVEPCERCEALAKKAKFSQHTLTEDEVQELRTAAAETVKEINGKLSVWEKFVFRYVRGLD